MKAWQEHTINMARATQTTRTLMGEAAAMLLVAHLLCCSLLLLGRYRPLPDINHFNTFIRGHAERAAINTPIQVRLVLSALIFTVDVLRAALLMSS